MVHIHTVRRADGGVRIDDITIVTHPVTDKTISRTHLIINIADVNHEDGVCLLPLLSLLPAELTWRCVQLKVLVRTQVTMQDNNTKFGTTVDGNRLKGCSAALGPADVHTFYLGKYKQAFRCSPPALCAPHQQAVSTYVAAAGAD